MFVDFVFLNSWMLDTVVLKYSQPIRHSQGHTWLSLYFLMCCDGLVWGFISSMKLSIHFAQLHPALCFSSFPHSGFLCSCCHRMRNNLLQIWHAATFGGRERRNTYTTSNNKVPPAEELVR